MISAISWPALVFVATTRSKLPIWGRFHHRMQGLEGFLWSLIRGVTSVEDRVAAVPAACSLRFTPC